MSTLVTLRDLAGGPAAPASLSESTLIIVDAQNTYREGVMALDGVEAALERCAELLERARSAGAPVVHIQHDSGAGTPFDIRTPIGAIAAPVAPREGEAVIVKNFPNAFVGTDLDARLKALGRDRLVVAGFMTHMCINSTTRGAFNLGYQVTVPGDATATRALPTADGGTLAASALQAASLAALGDLFAVVVAKAADVPA